mmetsp:Transcript_30849/g.76563  ORF Transcript_30849/g.76563 Transcript_30849/m.76563 type:complete len:284 (-) Transcript_30849:309-1160(-)
MGERMHTVGGTRLSGGCGVSPHVFLVLVEGVRVCQCTPVGYRPAVDDLAHGKLHDFAGLGAGDVAHRVDVRWHVPWCGVGSDLVFDLLDEGLIQLAVLPEFDEQNDLHVPLHALLVEYLASHSNRLLHLIQLVHLSVYLSGADPDAPRVEHGVRPAVHHHSAPVSDLGKVTMRPHVVILGEIRLLVFLVVWVVPEAPWLAGEGFGADELALLALDGLAVLIVHLNCHTEPQRLDLASVDRPNGVAKYEARYDVRAPRYGRQTHVILDLTIHIVEGLGSERRAC